MKINENQWKLMHLNENLSLARNGKRVKKVTVRNVLCRLCSLLRFSLLSFFLFSLLSFLSLPLLARSRTHLGTFLCIETLQFSCSIWKSFNSTAKTGGRRAGGGRQSDKHLYASAGGRRAAHRPTSQCICRRAAGGKKNRRKKPRNRKRTRNPQEQWKT